MTQTEPHTILLAGANRGLGLGLAQEFAGRGWHVIATARHPQKADALQALAKRAHGAGKDGDGKDGAGKDGAGKDGAVKDGAGKDGTGHGAVTVEALDIADPASLAAFAGKLEHHLGRARLDALFVVAGMSAAKDKTPKSLTHDEIAREFITNATAPVALAETLLPLLAEAAPVAFMTSILGSLASNAGGGVDLYRASKAALNMLGLNFGIRHKHHPVLLLHPGWVRTDMGGANAPVDVQTSARGLADIIGHRHKPGVHYLDYQSQKLPW